MWRHNITTHSMVHEIIKKFMDGFRYDAHPMGMLVGTVGALSTFYPEARNVDYVWMVNNVRGVTTERWFHAAGCRRWLTLTRDTITDRVVAV